MYIHKVKLINFRNFISTSVTVGLGVNFFYGDNGSGKTSVLEAINYLSQARSFRALKNSSIINYDAKEFILYSELFSESADLIYKLGIVRESGGDIKVNFNGSPLNRVADLANNICIQAIVPNGLSLLEAGPGMRRSFVDWGCFYHFHDFSDISTDFRKIIKQRNVLLASKTSPDYLNYWNNCFVNISVKVTGKRIEYLSIFNKYINEIIHRFLPNIEISLELSPGHKTDYEEFISQLSSHAGREYAMGYSLFGPQKADLIIKVNNKPSLDILSRGQQKLLVIALKLAQGIVYQKLMKTNCVYIIDDLGAELDKNSIDKVFELVDELSDDNQFFITSLENISEYVKSKFSKEIKMFHVEHNDISELII